MHVEMGQSALLACQIRGSPVQSLRTFATGLQLMLEAEVKEKQESRTCQTSWLFERYTNLGRVPATMIAVQEEWWLPYNAYPTVAGLWGIRRHN